MTTTPSSVSPLVTYNITGDGVTDDTAGFNAWFTSGTQLAIVPPGHYRIDAGNINLTNIAVVGCGVIDKSAPYNNSGTVFEITGTTNSPFIVGYGVTFQGVSFYYPNQTEANTTANNAPTVYPPLFSGPTASRCLWDNCTFINPYDIFQLGGVQAGQACGGFWIVNCRGFAVRRVLDIKSQSETSYMDNCHWSYGWYQDNVNVGPTYNLRNWSANNGSGIYIDTANAAYASIDALIVTKTQFFGMKYAINHQSGQTYAFKLIGNHFEAVSTVFLQVAAANDAYLKFSNNFINTSNVSNATTNVLSAIEFNSTTGPNLGSITDNIFASLPGNAIDINNVSGAGQQNIEINNNKFWAWGLNLEASGQISCAICLTAPNCLASTLR